MAGKDIEIHLQTGPGHHDGILISELLVKGLSFSVSGYHPKYSFSRYSESLEASKAISYSRVYELVKWLVWGFTNKFSVFRTRNRHLSITYSLYDYLTSRILKEKSLLLFGWAQVSLYSIRRVKRSGGLVVLDYPIPHIVTWQKMLNEESKKINVTHLRSMFTESMVNRMLEEIELADYISVPSEFVKKSFKENGVPESKLIFNSYGIDANFFSPSEKKRDDKRLVLLFVGSVEVRKGVHYLLEALNFLPNHTVELRIVGTKSDDLNHFYKIYGTYSNILWLGQLDAQSTLEEMRRADVMVMPSILEGLSLTILESMAVGTPVISTTNAGGLGLIDDGKDGFVVPIRDSKSIARKISWCLANREKLTRMGQLARKKILSGYTKEQYCSRFSNLVLPKYYEHLESGS